MDRQQLYLYRKPSWLERRKQIIQLDGEICCLCGRHEPEVVLQVHHKKYISGHKPWEYKQEDLITLCKGCHAREHNIISNTIPQDGWIYVDCEDLGGLYGKCEICKTEFRHEHYLYHPKYGYISVGCECANKLLNNTQASIKEVELKLEAKRLERFLNSPKWKLHKNCYFYDNLNDYKIMIVQTEYGFYITIYYKYYTAGYFGAQEKEQDIHSNTKYETLVCAKQKIYEAITSGKIAKYIVSNKLPRKGEYLHC